MTVEKDKIESAADRLASLYAQPFSGKPSGRFRIAAKFLRQLLGVRRYYEADIQALSRAMFERGFVVVDMETFVVVLSARTFVNYRRVNEECLE